jgi:hypothetical protein
MIAALGIIGGVVVIVVIAVAAFCLWLEAQWSKPGNGPP